MRKLANYELQRINSLMCDDAKGGIAMPRRDTDWQVGMYVEWLNETEEGIFPLGGVEFWREKFQGANLTDTRSPLGVRPPVGHSRRSTLDAKPGGVRTCVANLL